MAFRVTVLVMLLALLGWLTLNPYRDGGGRANARAELAPEPVADSTGRDPDPMVPAESPDSMVNGVASPPPRWEEPFPTRDERVATPDPQMTIVQWRSTIESEIWSAGEAELEERQQRANDGDPESAFWLSELLRLCLSQPRSDAARDHAMVTLEEALDSAMQSRPNMDPGWIEDRLEHSFKAFQVCSLIDPELELDRESLEWLGIAADLGHPGAQRLYHSHAHALLLGQLRPYGRFLAIMEPVLIEDFKIRADRYARALLDSGDPRALLLMARMMALGDVYPQDLVQAYGYALAARNDGTPGLQPSANAWIQQLTTQLSEDQLSAARTFAAELDL